MELTKENKILIIIAIILCIALAVLSPMIASSNPDGLEKSAEDAGVSEDVETSFFKSPFPDYTFEPLDKIGETGVLILGCIITLIVAFGIGAVLKKRS